MTDVDQKHLTSSQEREQLLRAGHGHLVIRTCFAWLGSQAEAERAFPEVFESMLEDLSEDEAAEPTAAHVLAVARRVCARRIDTRGRPETKPTGVARLLGDLRPTEREALVLRYIAGLSGTELAEACGVDAAAAEARTARGLARLRDGVTGPSELCERVAERMPDLLEGHAPADLSEHASSCDFCRDARHDADLAVRQLCAFADQAVLPSALAPSPLPASAPTAPAAPPPVATRGARLAAMARRWAVPVLAAAAAAAVLAGRSRAPGTSADDPELVGPPWRGQVSKLLSRGGKLELCAPSGGSCHDLRQGDEVPAGSVLKTDRSTLAELSFTDGSALSLDRSTSLRLSTRGRGGELLLGGVVADIAHHENWSARFELKGGHVDVLGTKFSLRSDGDSGSVHVARGSVQLADRSGHNAVVMAGEEGRLDAGAAPVVSPASSLGEALGWSDSVARAEADDEPEARPRALGELKAQKPGERSERAGAVRLDSHAVRVKIAGSIARTEVEEVFTNQTDDVLEGIFRFPLPPDAKIERLALEVDGKLEEGTFVDRDRASAIWRGAIVNAAPQLRQELKDEIVWVPGPWRDPALLEWQRGGRFELRIYPIPKRGSRRVVLAYSQLVKQSAGLRHYSYPLGFDPSGNATPLDFSLDVQLRGTDPSTRVRTPGWDVSREREDGAERLRFDARAFVPDGDFSVDYAVPERATELSAWAYREPTSSADGDGAYVAMALRPRLPKRVSAGPLRAVALVVDASRSVFGENYRRATALATRLARDLDASSRVTVLACDSTCREMSGDLRVPGAQTARDVRRFLEHETPEGASDVTLAVKQGFQAIVGSGRQPEVIYIGDGVATAGPTRSSTIERAVRAALPGGGRVTSLGIGPESDAESLLALARGGSGTALPYVPGQPLGDAALAAASAVYGATLSDVHVELPAGLSQISPARLEPIAAGAELVIAGRTRDAAIQGDVVLRGVVDGRPFEQRYRLDVSVSDSSGNAFVPRLFAQSRIVDLERDGSDSAKREAVALSTRHGVASRFTSLLVLESEAMYKAFGLDTSRKMPDYTADLEAEGSSASGELALGEEEESAKDKAAAPGDATGSLARRDAPRPATKAPIRNSLRGRDDVDMLNPFEGPSSDESLKGGGGAIRPGASGGGLSGIGQPAPAPKPAKPAFAPPPAASSPAPEPAEDRRAEKKRVLIEEDSVLQLEPERNRPRPRPMIPMRRIWERKGEVFTDRFVPQAASGSALSDAERDLLRDDTRRQNLKRTFALSSAAGDLSEAARLAERWLEKEPLDPEALTALADVEARRGHRELAIRMLGSVLDARPGDTASHKRLARLERWAGHLDLACRHSIAIAENKSKDLGLLAEAIACARNTGMTEVADALLASSPEGDRAGLEQRLAQPPADPEQLSGDVRLEAHWDGGVDVDLSLLDTDGHRVSWLGAATRSVISARDTTSTSREGLALRGAAPGEYVIELVRGAGPGDAQGELTVSVAGNVRRIPFRFDGDRKTVALLRISMQPRLVPL